MNRVKLDLVALISKGESLKLGTMYLPDNGPMYFQYDLDYLLSKRGKMLFDKDIEPVPERQYATTANGAFSFLLDIGPEGWGNSLTKPIKQPISLPAVIERSILNNQAMTMGCLSINDPTNELLVGLSEYEIQGISYLKEIADSIIKIDRNTKVLPVSKLKLRDFSSPLAGMRPKVGYLDEDGSEWIAKFPGGNDEWNVGAWEKTCLDLAKLCGLKVEEYKVLFSTTEGEVLGVRRFDRSPSRERIPCISALTATGKGYGDDTASYDDMASFLKAYGSSPKADLKELFKRLIFNIAVSNTDDHFGNHAFLLNKHGWTLAPLFDLISSPFGYNLTLKVGQKTNSLSYKNAIEDHKAFYLTKLEAEQITNRIYKTVKKGWLKTAKSNGLTITELDQMSLAMGKTPDF